MISDSLFSFAVRRKNTFRQWLLYAGVCTLAIIPLFFLGMVLACIDVFGGRESWPKRLLMGTVLTFGPILAAPILFVGSILSASLAVSSYMLGGLFFFLEKITFRRWAYERAEGVRIAEEAGLIRQAEVRLRAEHEANQERVRQEMWRRNELFRVYEPRIAVLPQPVQRDDEEGLLDNIRQATIAYQDAPHDRKQEPFNRLRTLYNTYVGIFPLEADPRLNAANHILQNNSDLQEQKENADEDYLAMLREFNKLFSPLEYKLHNSLPAIPNLDLQKPVHVLKQPLNNAQIEKMQERIRIKSGDDEKTQSEKMRYQNIFNSVINDNLVTFDTIYAPVRIPNGRTLDLMSVVKMRQYGGGRRLLPDRTDIDNVANTFTLSQVLPNNTLSRGINSLLNICEGNTPEAIQFNSPLKTQIEQQIASSTEAKDISCLTDQDVKDFKAFYDALDQNRGHKTLFDLMCKDPITGQIFRDPIYLPDGYTYERSTVMALLRLNQNARKSAPCPFAEHLSFTEADIRTCFSTRDLLDTIKQEIKLIKQTKPQEQGLSLVGSDSKADEPANEAKSRQPTQISAIGLRNNSFLNRVAAEAKNVRSLTASRSPERRM